MFLYKWYHHLHLTIGTYYHPNLLYRQKPFGTTTNNNISASRESTFTCLNTHINLKGNFCCWSTDIRERYGVIN